MREPLKKLRASKELSKKLPALILIFALAFGTTVVTPQSAEAGCGGPSSISAKKSRDGLITTIFGIPGLRLPPRPAPLSQSATSLSQLPMALHLILMAQCLFGSTQGSPGCSMGSPPRT